MFIEQYADSKWGKMLIIEICVNSLNGNHYTMLAIFVFNIKTKGYKKKRLQNTL